MVEIKRGGLLQAFGMALAMPASDIFRTKSWQMVHFRAIYGCLLQVTRYGRNKKGGLLQAFGMAKAMPASENFRTKSWQMVHFRAIYGCLLKVIIIRR
jgi:hypothetical protein